MRLPTELYGVTNLAGLIVWLRTLAVSIAAGWGVEHSPDGTHGTIHASGAIYERGRAASMGEVVTPAFNAANFTSTGVGTAWGVDAADVIAYAYTIVGNVMTVFFDIRNTDVTGTPTTLNLAIPGGYTAATDTRNFVLAVDAGAADVGQARVVPGNAYIEFFTDLAATAWAATSSDNTRVTGQIQFGVNT